MEAPGPPSGTELVANEPADLDVFSVLAIASVRTSSRSFPGPYERLVDQADGGEIFFELPIDDLLGGRGGLAQDLGGGDVAFLRKVGFGHLLARDVERARGGYLEAEVAHESLEAVVARERSPSRS